MYQSNFDLTQNVGDYCATFNLAQNTAQTYTVPGTAQSAKYSIRFNYASTSNVFVAFLGATIVLPTAGNSQTTANVEFKPGYEGSQRFVKGGDVLSFETPDSAGAYVGISLRQLPG